MPIRLQKSPSNLLGSTILARMAAINGGWRRQCSSNEHWNAQKGGRAANLGSELIPPCRISPTSSAIFGAIVALSCWSCNQGRSQSARWSIRAKFTRNPSRIGAPPSTVSAVSNSIKLCTICLMLWMLNQRQMPGPWRKICNEKKIALPIDIRAIYFLPYPPFTSLYLSHEMHQTAFGSLIQVRTAHRIQSHSAQGNHCFAPDRLVPAIFERAKREYGRKMPAEWEATD